MTNSREWTFPASFGQERIWLSNQLDPASPVYNLPCGIRQDLPMTEDQWRKALTGLVRRHESLRTSFRVVDGVLTQVVHEHVPVAPVVHDLRALPADQARQRADELAADLGRTPIPLDAPPLWRALLCRLADDGWELTFVVHHAVFDAGSMLVFRSDLDEFCAAVVEGREPRLPELSIQYPDFSAWQRGQLDTPAIAEQLAYWRARLAGVAPVHALPTDRPRPAELSFAGDQVDFRLPEGLLDRVGALGREQSATPFMVLLAGYVALLARLSDVDDVVVGVPVAGRDLPELAPLIGMFVNQLAIRVDCAGDPAFTELVGRVRTAVLDAIEHSQVPFQAVAQALALERDPGVQALYQIGFNFIPHTGIEDVRYTTSKDDLAIDLTAWNGRLLYRTDLFDRATGEALVDRYFRVLQAGIAEPSTALSRLPLLSDAERAQVLDEWSGAVIAAPRETVHGLIEQQVRRTPDAVAVDFGERLTYAELNARANRVAHGLRTRGAGAGTLVGVAMPNSADLVVTLLGVLKSGAAYVPLDPDLPAKRRALVVEDAGISLVLDGSSTWDDQPTGDPEPLAGPQDVAYVIYTSGSTGRPKGVQVEHAAVACYLSWARDTYPGLAGKALLHTSASFDLTVTTLFGPLVAGGSIVDDKAGRPEFVKATPTHLAVLADERYPSVDLVLGGEALAGEVVQPWRAKFPGTAVTNEYGPTEATVGCVAHRIAPGDELPAGPVRIGKPVAGARVYVLDAHGRPVPPGGTGQLHVAGPQLARGYLGRPELTEERFLPCPFGAPGERMYATGDVARWRRDGTLDYLGRADDQVKLRGYRIELGEVEAAMRELPGVQAAAVAVHRTELGDNLVGYLVGESAGVAEALRQTLPEYMVPTAFVIMDALPVAASGKLDRAALPAPQPAHEELYVAPRTAAEELVAEVFAELLGVDKIGVHDDFFALGGNSLLAIRAMARIRKQVEVEIPVRGLFAFTTVAGLAEEIERRLAADLDQLSDEEVERMLAEPEDNA
ncbi:non-ribosomal peptide synthetase [Labedaea rhizosphaerae]|uniref:Amino acid adenylation domain-containing protein n=1 Tax=Labedaea rhizosphaerae TaxID=598644 RepID=A0A4V3CX66_LABRH|nr:non-ribosomal peptide synthetase [Labedaea rhizosphaerae]TDP89068.1 amino acid adenylation domain-containing protein [Labedaea rhizosphaerae]